MIVLKLYTISEISFREYVTFSTDQEGENNTDKICRDISKSLIDFCYTRDIDTG